MTVGSRRACALIVLIVGVASASACQRRLVHPVDCDNMLRLRLGQSPEEVEALVGPPAFAAPQPSAFGDGNHWTKRDTIWLYDAGPGTLVSDEFTIEFFEQKLVRASAYRRYSTGWAKRISNAYLLDAHHDPQPDLGPAFESVFTCRPGFVRK